MAKASVAQVPAKLYELLEPLTPEERLRVVQATLLLFGDDASATASQPGAPRPPVAPKASSASAGAASYFNQKDPQNKGELLAVAAKFLEETESQETHSKSDLKRIVTDAHRNFDSTHFARDMNNAKRQAGFFNLGTGRDSNKLSYYGKQYVDALPDREAAGRIRRPKIGGAKKSSASKKKAKKKSARS